MKTYFLTLGLLLVVAMTLHAGPSGEVKKLVDQDLKLELERLLAKNAKEGDRETVKLLTGLRRTLGLANLGSPKDTHWNWRSGGELVLEADGEATHTEWKRKGRWSLNQDGSIRLDSQTGTHRITFLDGVGQVTHLGKGGFTTITPRKKNAGTVKEKVQAHPRCEVGREGERTVITTNVANAPLSTFENFRTPFRVQARAATDGSLRFYFGQSGIVIFNWDMNARELRVGDPGTPLPQQRGFAGAGDLKPGQAYDFEIVVKRDKICVLVDGKRKAELPGDFSKTEGPVGIGASTGSKVWIDSFKGIQEKEKSGAKRD